LLLAVEVQFGDPYALDCRQGFSGAERHIFFIEAVSEFSQKQKC